MPQSEKGLGAGLRRPVLVILQMAQFVLSQYPLSLSTFPISLQ